MDEESYTTPTTSRGSFFYSTNPSPPLHPAPMNNNNSTSTWRNNNNNLLEMNYLFHHPQPKSEATPSSSHSYQLTRQLEEEEHETSVIKSKIISHPQYSDLLEVYMDCHKVGASAEIVNRLTAVRREYEAHQKATMATTIVQRDPELDQFMEAYYNMVVKYREELTRPWQEAMEFIKRTEAQLKSLSNDPIMIFSDKKYDAVGSSEDEHGDDSRRETELAQIDPRAEDRELKNHLLKKYSGYLSNLKQELSKKKKKGKLPKEARQKLLNWWELHYKWPYPSESEKLSLAESTGLDQKQINNWFINQRKRHWKPSEDMQFVVMEGLHPQNAALYMEGHYMTDAGHYRLGP